MRRRGALAAVSERASDATLIQRCESVALKLRTIGAFKVGNLLGVESDVGRRTKSSPVAARMPRHNKRLSRRPKARRYSEQRRERNQRQPQSLGEPRIRR